METKNLAKKTEENKKDTLAIIGSLMKNEKFANCFCNLYSRWQDEKQYEDINDYSKAREYFLKATVENVQVMKPTKRPFGFVVRIHEYWDIHFTCNSREIKWAQVK